MDTVDAVSRHKVRAIQELSSAVMEGRLDLEGWAVLDGDVILQRLCALRGVDRWSAEYALLRGRGNACVPRRSRRRAK